MNTRDFLKTILGGTALGVGLPVFASPKCPNCGAGLTGKTCDYCKSPIIELNPDATAMFCTPEMDSVEDVSPKLGEAMLEESVYHALIQTFPECRSFSVKAQWVGRTRGYYRVELVRAKPRSLVSCYGYGW